MKIKDFIKSSSALLEDADIGSARLDCLIILEDCLGKDKSWILANDDKSLSTRHLKNLNLNLDRRLKHEPMAYIRGFTEFYGHNFYIDKNVLEPRSESEDMIDQLMRLDLPSKPTILDLGTGSGALAIVAKFKIPDSIVIATDIDSKALTIARRNIKSHKVSVATYEGDLLLALPSKVSGVDAILANLPYVPKDWKLNKAAMMEPRVAIYGGKDGLDIYRQMFEQIDGLPFKPRVIFTESLPPQHKTLKKLASKHSYQQTLVDNFIQVFRSS